MALTITTPLQTLVAEDGIESLRADDASGGFGILPGHVDFLTVLTASVVRWRKADGPWRFCALRGGVMLVSGGTEVRIACREAVTGTDLAGLEARVVEHKAAESEAARRARSERARLHARAIRQIMGRMTATGQTGEVAFEELFG